MAATRTIEPSAEECFRFDAASELGPFDDRQMSVGRNDAAEPESRSLQQVLKLGPSSFAAPWRQHQHFQVQELAEMRRIARRDHGVDEEQPPAR